MTSPDFPHTGFERFLSWTSRHLSQEAFLVSLALLTGIAAGAGATLLKLMVGRVARPVADTLATASANWQLLFIPVIGILLAGIFQRYIIRRELFHGVDRMREALAARRYRFPLSLTVTPLIANAITLGLGGSAGSEGPIAYVGGAVGSNLGRICRLDDNAMRVMIACGASAGIAGIFKAPIGGALFSLEVLCLDMSVVAIVAVLVASLAAGLTAFMLSGCSPDVAFAHQIPMELSWLPWLLLLGLFCGFYSVYYATVMSRMSNFYGRMRNPWARNLLAGSILAVTVFLFPALYGEGYGFIELVLEGNAGAVTNCSLFSHACHTWEILLIFGAILAVKAFAVASTNSGGGVAGDFAPTLFAGCLAGYFFATLVNELFHAGMPPADFAFFAMAAVMAGAIRAPLMAIILTVEVAQTYMLLFPVVVVATVSYCVVRIVRPQPAPVPRS